MTRDEAARWLRLLEIECQDAGKIRAAWAQEIRACHSDTSESGTDNAPRLAMLTQARDILLSQRIAPEIRCKQCRGRGTLKALKGRMGVVKCPACKGTGDKL